MSAAFLPGDCLFFWGSDYISRTISAMTAWPVRVLGKWGPSHVGVVVTDHANMLIESTSLLSNRPCLITERERSGPQAQELCCRIEDYTSHGGRVEVLRLKRPLDTQRQRDLRDRAFRLVLGSGDQSYDLPGAVLSATRFLRWWLPSTEDAVWFCSELVRRLLVAVDVLSGGINCATPHALYRELTWGTVAPYRRHALYYPGEKC